MRILQSNRTSSFSSLARCLAAICCFSATLAVFQDLGIPGVSVQMLGARPTQYLKFTLLKGPDPPVSPGSSSLLRQRFLHTDSSSKNDTSLLIDDTESTITVIEEEEQLAVVVSFEDVLQLSVFIATAWLASNVCVAIGLPGLVGEICTGFILGPPLLDFCPFPEAMVLIGNFGLIGLMVDSGIHLDIAQLKETGTQAILIAFSGTILSVGTAIGIAYIRDAAENFASAMAIAACFAPSSLGVAAAVLSKGEILNTSVGQLIVSSSVVDDVLGLILLSLLNVKVMDDPSTWNYFQPFVASFGFLIVLGYLGIRWIPSVIQNHILSRYVPKAHHETVTCGIMFTLMIIYLPLMNYSAASYLTGAFLAGLSVSQLSSIHTAYQKNEALMVWLMRVFFTATIGFQVPIVRYNNLYILSWAAIFLLPVMAKLPVGLLVPRFGKEIPDNFPFNPYVRDAIFASLSIFCRGEFNFVVAASGLSLGLLNADMYSAIVLAVLISSILGPLALSQAIRYYGRKTESYLSSPHTIKHIEPDSVDGYRPLFIAIQVRTPTTWNLQQKFLEVLEEYGLLQLDYRTWHTNDMEAVTMTEIFVQDTLKSVRVENCFQVEKMMESTKRSVMGEGVKSVLDSLGNIENSLKSGSDTSPERGSSQHTYISDSAHMSAPPSPGAFTAVSAGNDASFSLGICSKRAIELRIEQVDEAFHNAFGDVDFASYAVKVMQWNPFLKDAPADYNDLVRSRTYSFHETESKKESLVFSPPDEEVNGASMDSNSVGELYIPQSFSGSSTMPEDSKELSISFGGLDSIEKSDSLVSTYTDDGTQPRPPPRIPRPQLLSQSKSVGTRRIPRPTTLKPHHRTLSHGQPMIGDLWDTDSVARKCVGGKSRFTVPHLADDEAFLKRVAVYNDDDRDFDSAEEQNGGHPLHRTEGSTTPTQGNIRHHRQSRSLISADGNVDHARLRRRNLSMDARRVDEETAAIQRLLHGYVRKK